MESLECVICGSKLKSYDTYELDGEVFCYVCFVDNCEHCGCYWDKCSTCCDCGAEYECDCKAVHLAYDTPPAEGWQDHHFLVKCYCSDDCYHLEDED